MYQGPAGKEISQTDIRRYFLLSDFGQLIAIWLTWPFIKYFFHLIKKSSPCIKVYVYKCKNPHLGFPHFPQSMMVATRIFGLIQSISKLWSKEYPRVRYGSERWFRIYWIKANQKTHFLDKHLFFVRNLVHKSYSTWHTAPNRPDKRLVSLFAVRWWSLADITAVPAMKKETSCINLYAS